jgi:hypothetical protein
LQTKATSKFKAGLYQLRQYSDTGGYISITMDVYGAPRSLLEKNASAEGNVLYVWPNVSPYRPGEKYSIKLNGSTLTLNYGQFIRCPIGDKQTIEVSKRDNTVIVHRILGQWGVYLGVGGCCDVVPVIVTATIRDFPRGFAQLLLHTVLSQEVTPSL